MKTQTILPKLLLIGSLLFGYNAAAQYTQQAKVVSPDRESRDEYGTATDIRGDYAISGTPRYNIAAGAAYIYEINRDGEWNHFQTLIPDDAQEMAEFGGAVKMAEDYIVVASGRADIGTTVRAGALYVYDYNGSSWDFSTKLVASDYSSDAKLGMNNTTIDAEGETIVSGAPADGGWVGSVYVFERSEDIWNEVQKIENPTGSNDTFGISVALSGDTMVVGANESNGLKGAAYVYVKESNGLWVMEQEIAASDSASGDYFGSSVSIDGETIVVGAYGNNSVKGAAYVFKKDTSGNWVEVQKLVSSTQITDAHFGWQCEIKGNNVVVSAPHIYAFTQGEVFMFQEDASGQWMETQIIQGEDSVSEDFFGWAVSMYEDQIMVGAPWEDEDENGENPVDRAGSAYIFKSTTLGSEDFNSKISEITAFPNPAENTYTIESSIKAINNIFVYSINGVVIQEMKAINNHRLTLDVQGFSKGIYVVEIEFENGSSTIQKLIKK